MLVMTMMVRDEADIIAATIEHHLSHGIDHLIVTDNASVDGTAEILEAYARHAPITVLHDGEHRKQQAEVVTRMARQAHAMGATWVVNGDADEFLRPVDPATTLADVFAAMPVELGEIRVPVVNLVGAIAATGAGFERLVLRDERSQAQLDRVGILSHPTPNAIHVATPDVEVVQGNHATSIGVGGDVPDELALEVLHLPWRNVAQVERKTENMGSGYDASPDLRPSANHHGMRDWRRLRGGVLLPFLALRMPLSSELAGPGYREDTTLLASLESLHPVLGDELRASLARSEPFADAEVVALRARADALAAFDAAAHADVVQAMRRSTELEHELASVVTNRDELAWHAATLQEAREEEAAEGERLRAEIARLQEQVAEFERHPLRRAIQVLRHDE